MPYGDHFSSSPPYRPQPPYSASTAAADAGDRGFAFSDDKVPPESRSPAPIPQRGQPVSCSRISQLEPFGSRLHAPNRSTAEIRTTSSDCICDCPATRVAPVRKLVLCLDEALQIE